jgi:micrococcal nuclease
MYEYQAVIVSVHDGDTVRADVDLGFSLTWRAMDLRLYGINAPELSTPAGAPARDALIGQVLGKRLTIRTVKDRTEKFGRYLATLLVPQPDGTLLDVNQWMVTSGHAVVYFP